MLGWVYYPIQTIQVRRNACGETLHCYACGETLHFHASGESFTFMPVQKRFTFSAFLCVSSFESTGRFPVRRSEGCR